MTNIKIQDENLAKKLLAVRDICGFTADYLVLNLHHFESKPEQYIIYNLSSNLNRSVKSIEIELISRGLHCQDRPYCSSSFENLSYLDVDLVALVKDYIAQKSTSKKQNEGKARNLVRQLHR
ncbi:MAG: hypothetical protein OQJ89_16650 [Kangiellaceae bacterium]|nr:hypothetical protein [Kangiellaceae bacterium]MCW9018605.1 hypothetical protein [Kangiellaceae bacterium]